MKCCDWTKTEQRTMLWKMCLFHNLPSQRLLFKMSHYQQKVDLPGKTADSMCLYFCLSVLLFACLRVCPSVCLSVYLSAFLVLTTFCLLFRLSYCVSLVILELFVSDVGGNLTVTVQYLLPNQTGRNGYVLLTALSALSTVYSALYRSVLFK